MFFSLRCPWIFRLSTVIWTVHTAAYEHPSLETELVKLTRGFVATYLRVTHSLSFSSSTLIFNARNSIASRPTVAGLLAIVTETREQKEVEPVQSLRLIGVRVKEATERGNGTETLRGERASDAPFLSLLILRRTDPDAHYVMHMQTAKRIKDQWVWRARLPLVMLL